MNNSADLKVVINEARQRLPFLQGIDTRNPNFERCKLVLKEVKFNTSTFDPNFAGNTTKEVQVNDSRGRGVSSTLTTTGGDLPTSSITINTGYVTGDNNSLTNTTTLSIKENDIPIDMRKPYQDLSLPLTNGDRKSNQTVRGSFKATVKSEARLIQGSFEAIAHLSGNVLFPTSDGVKLGPVERMAEAIGDQVKPFSYFDGRSGEALTWRVTGSVDLLLEAWNVVDVRQARR